MGNDRLERNLEYLKWYRALKEQIGIEEIFLADNSSPWPFIEQFFPGWKHEDDGQRGPPGDESVASGDLFIRRYGKHLGRVPGHHGYIFCWRALYQIQSLFDRGFDKVIAIDSDGYVVSGRFARWLRDLKSGWTSVWCPRHSFPESSIFVLCRDALPIFQKFCEVPYEQRVGELMEQVLPFTHVERGFICDRYGETSQPQPDPCDYYGQRRLATPMTFRETL